MIEVKWKCWFLNKSPQRSWWRLLFHHLSHLPWQRVPVSNISCPWFLLEGRPIFSHTFWQKMCKRKKLFVGCERSHYHQPDREAKKSIAMEFGLLTLPLTCVIHERRKIKLFQPQWSAQFYLLTHVREGLSFLLVNWKLPGWQKTRSSTAFLMTHSL